MHPRQTIRDAVTGLLTGATAAAGRVYPTRVLDYRLIDLPVLAVYSLDESIDSDHDTAPRELKRTISLIVEGWVAPGNNVDNTMDDLCLEIETAMHADPYLGGCAYDSRLTGTVLEAIDEGQKELGFLAMSYDVIYMSDAPAAPTGLDDFETVNSEINLGGDVDPAETAIDDFVVEETP